MRGSRRNLLDPRFFLGSCTSTLLWATLGTRGLQTNMAQTQHESSSSVINRTPRQTCNLRLFKLFYREMIRNSL